MLESSVQAERRRLSTFRHQPVTTSKASTPKIQPSLFLDDLEAAADIVKWEQEQFASEDPVPVHEISPEYYSEVKPVNIRETQKPKTSNVKQRISIEDELAAAADIAMWEEEQKLQFAIADEIAAAAEIAQWENEQFANGAIHKDSHTPSDEIAAVAAMVEWGLDHQDGKVATVNRLVIREEAQFVLLADTNAGFKPAASAIVTDDDDPEHDQPHFQLLSTVPAVARTSHANVVTPTHTAALQPGGAQKLHQRVPSTTSQKRKSEHDKKCEFITQFWLLTLISLLLQHQPMISYPKYFFFPD